MMLPIDMFEVTQSVVGMLKASPDLDGVTIEDSAEINREPKLKGWVGVYRVGVKFVTKAIGVGVPREQRAALMIIVQHSDMNSGEECGKALEALNRRVLSVLLSDETLGGKVDVLDPTDFEVRYTDYTKIDNIFMQNATNFLTGLARVQVQ